MYRVGVIHSSMTAWRTFLGFYNPHTLFGSPKQHIWYVESSAGKLAQENVTWACYRIVRCSLPENGSRVVCILAVVVQSRAMSTRGLFLCALPLSLLAIETASLGTFWSAHDFVLARP